MRLRVVIRLSVAATLLVACTSAAPPAEVAKAASAEPTKVVPTPVVTAPAVEPVQAVPPTVPVVEDGVPSTRPRSLGEARTHLLAIARSHDLSHLVDLVDPALGLEFTYSPEGKRRTRKKLKIDRASFAAQFAGGEPWTPQQYVGSVAEEFDPEAVTADPNKPVVAYAPDAAWGLDFVFKKRGEALVLTTLAVWDQEP